MGIILIWELFSRRHFPVEIPIFRLHLFASLSNDDLNSESRQVGLGRFWKSRTNAPGKLKDNRCFKLKKNMSQIIKNCSLQSSSTYGSAEEAIRVWKERPNVINRRLCGCGNFWSKSYNNELKTEKNHQSFIKFLSDEIVEHLTEIRSIHTDRQPFKDDLNRTLNAIFELSFESKVKFDVRPIKSDNDEQCLDEEIPGMKLDLTLRKLLPRSMKKFKITIELVLSFARTCSG